jgi:FkbM family methyltransferase
VTSLKKRWNRFKNRRKPRPEQGVEPLPPESIGQADAIVTVNEVTDRHGTGVILDRIFGASPNILSIRSTNLYGEHKLGAAQLRFGQEGLTRAESFHRVLYALNGATVQRVLCVPYQPDELITSIVLKELFGAPLCVFVMDDNNIFSRGIPDDLMREALEKASLRLAISPELRNAYEQKYNLKFWLVPPVVGANAVRRAPQIPAGKLQQDRVGVLVGSLWSRVWLEKLRRTVKDAGLQVHWYGNSKAWASKVSARELLGDGIVDGGFLPEAELTEKLKEYPYAIVPSGTLDEQDDRPEIARLSLPTRLPYLVAAANIPMIALGNPNTAAARFLARFQVGKTVPYDGAKLRQAVEEICQPAEQSDLRGNAAGLAPLFSAEGLDSWIWKALAEGEPGDERFEQAFYRTWNDIVPYLDAPSPKDLGGDLVPVYHGLRRLKRQGFDPDFVLDVGASSGVWSDAARRVFPKARFILVDPLHAHYRKINDWYFRKHPQFEHVPVAVSDRKGEAELSVSSDLYGSSLLRPVAFRSYDSLKVPVLTLDEIALNKQITGHGLLKLDVQFAEHLALAGAVQLLPQIDALLVELSLVGYASQEMLFHEMCTLIKGLGFRYYEDMGGWRSPMDGTLLQKDVLFVKEKLFPYYGRKALPSHRNGDSEVSSTRAAPAGTGSVLQPASV